jgi:GDPmannose 4,6-dehydratase
MRRAVITGIAGQDGSYLTELLLAQGYEVHGIVRHNPETHLARLEHLLCAPDFAERRLFLHHANLEDAPSLRRVLVEAAPHEIYHLAGQSHVGKSFESPEATCALAGMGTLRLLEMARELSDPVRFFHASSSEVFGQPEQSPQDEQTPFAPISPYGCAKAFASHLVRVYRRSFGLFACDGLLYNHESPRRGEAFVTRKICRAAAAIRLGRQQELWLGDLDARRDWGDARDYVRGMWLALQHTTAEDFVFATGVQHTVRDIAAIAFGALDLDWQAFVKHDERLVRPADPCRLVGNPAKAGRLLGWTPRTEFRTLITEMTEAEHAALAQSR